MSKLFIFFLIIIIGLAVSATDLQQNSDTHTNSPNDYEWHKQHTLSFSDKALPTMQPHNHKGNKNRLSQKRPTAISRNTQRRKIKFVGDNTPLLGAAS